MAAAIEAKHETVYDVGSQQVGRVYAEALLSAAAKQGKADAMLDQLDSLVADLFSSSPNFERFLASGAIRRHAKQQVIENTLGGKADPLFVNFLLVLNDNDRLNAIRPIWSTYRNLYDARQRRIRVKVRTAAPLTPTQEDRLKKELHDAYNLEPILDVRVDPDLLAGLVVQVGDMVFDGSVRSRLERMRNQLMVRSSHEIQSQRDRFRS
jgi:F-type H+-transporting ATPase subunit delta